MKKRMNNFGIILFISFVFTGCGHSAKEIEARIREDLKREQETVDKVELLKANIAAEEENERVIAVETQRQLEENKKLERRFRNVSEVYVNVKRAYFHGEPDALSIRESYLVMGDRASIIRMKNGFAYIEFYNQNSGKSTNGWIKLTDFEIEEEGGC